MTPSEQSMLDYTVSHFEEVARQNRFAENSQIPHDVARCAVCHPEKLAMAPFRIYAHVIVQSVKVRRPRLDEELLAQMNGDLELSGDPRRVRMESLLSGEEEAMTIWREWLRDALATGLSLVGVHSATSLDFDLDEEEEKGNGDIIVASIQEIMDYQMAHRG